MNRCRSLAVATALLAQLVATCGFAQSRNASTYQGRLTDESGPVNGVVTLEFRLFDSPTGDTLVAGPVTASDVSVVDGMFATDLDFGSYFADTGKSGWIEIRVMTASGPVTISPRQRLAPAPLATGLAKRMQVDVNNTSDMNGPRVNGHGGIVPAYVSFQPQSSGTLGALVFRARFGQAYTPTFYGEIRAGGGTEGPLLGNIEQAIGITPIDQDIVLDLSSLNIQVVADEWYSITVLCGVNFATTSQPNDRVAGVNNAGESVDWWFQSLLLEPTNAYVRSAQYAGSAQTANSATSALVASHASTATSAEEAHTARILNSIFPAFMNDFELQLRQPGNPDHGLAWFGSTRPFGNVNFAPDGPVLFGRDGGGLGTRQSGAGNIALWWNREGDTFTGGNITVGRDVTVLQDISVSGGGAMTGNLTVNGRLGLGTSLSNANYRLELPNIAGPGGQGRANAWVTYSSRKFKDQIETFPNALETLNKLRGVTFVWNTPLADGTLKHDIGFIAEEVAKAAPELVTCTESGDATGLDYGKVVPITVEAIKAQQRELDELRALNADLLARLEALEHSLSSQPR